MSTPVPHLCVICKKKPRHGTFPYCGKTCASKAVTLCNNCYAKNKFPPFDYCGKTCAATANAKAANNNNAPIQAPLGVAGPQIAANANTNGSSKNLPPKPYVAQAPPAPLYPSPLPLPSAPLGTKYTNPNIPPDPANAVTSTVLQTVQRVFSGGSQQQTLPPKAQPFGQANGRGQYGQAPVGPPHDCLIPGCGKPVHVDENGIPASDYCSQRHREQAVNSGMVSPCIMCLSLPQGDIDHFCSRLCREEALSKPT
ncbi:hypothetical protein PILCRDRAFT_822558 [Piloderma croceum F 1598]|uniref:Uncharacterized protein n=1 Tax=Piloderma croceum (strain F 1598) TaxID=765440 RepID=A0A0C3BSU3_PILCF|nr:hypothetical protein PILCRDRAFT_822558 [Piloderma croceum F 1598]